MWIVNTYVFFRHFFFYQATVLQRHSGFLLSLSERMTGRPKLLSSEATFVWGKQAKASTVHSGTQYYTVGRMWKTRQKLDLKKSCNEQIILMPATIWQVLSIKLISRKTEILVNLLKFARKNSWNHINGTYFVADFWHLEPLCTRQQAWRQAERRRLSAAAQFTERREEERKGRVSIS